MAAEGDGQEEEGGGEALRALLTKVLGFFSSSHIDGAQLLLPLSPLYGYTGDGEPTNLALTSDTESAATLKCALFLPPARFYTGHREEGAAAAWLERWREEGKRPILT